MENNIENAWDYLEQCLDDCKAVIEDGIPDVEDEDKITNFNLRFYELKEAIKEVEEAWCAE